MKHIAMSIDNAALASLPKPEPKGKKKETNHSYYLRPHIYKLPLPRAAHSLLRALTDRGITSWCSLSTLGNLIKYSKRTISRAIKALAENCLIFVKHRRQGKQNLTNVITLNPQIITTSLEGGGIDTMSRRIGESLKNKKTLVFPKSLEQKSSKTQQVFAIAENKNQMPQPQPPEPPLPLAETEALQAYHHAKTVFSCLPEDLPRKMPTEASFLTATARAGTNPQFGWKKFKERAMSVGEVIKSIPAAYAGFMNNWISPGCPRDKLGTNSGQNQSNDSHAREELEMLNKSRGNDDGMGSDKPKYKFWSKEEQETEDPYRICPADVMIYEQHQASGKPLPDHLAARYAQQPWLIDANWRQKMGKPKPANQQIVQSPGPSASVKQNGVEADLWPKKTLVVPGQENIALDDIQWD